MAREIVINSTSKLVVRHGFAPMSAGAGEEVVVNDFIFDALGDWYWTGSTFTQTPPESALVYVKAKRMGDIDQKTRSLIAAGFTHGGKQLSLATTAQTNILGLEVSKADPLLNYPVEVNTIDNQDKLQLNNAGNVTDMFTQARSTLRGHLDGGTNLKNQVRAATTVSAVLAIVDAR